MYKKLNPNQLLAGAACFLALGLLIEMQGLPSFGSKDPSVECQKVVKRDAILSETQIGKLLTVKKGESKDTLRSILKEPYCTLRSESVQVGANNDREVYLVAADDFVQFDPKTKLVVLYQGDQYAGYRFWVR